MPSFELWAYFYLLFLLFLAYRYLQTLSFSQRGVWGASLRLPPLSSVVANQLFPFSSSFTSPPPSYFLHTLNSSFPSILFFRFNFIILSRPTPPFARVFASFLVGLRLRLETCLFPWSPRVSSPVSKQCHLYFLATPRQSLRITDHIRNTPA